MAEALHDCFFKTHPHPVPKKFPDDPLAVELRPFSPITAAEISDALHPMSNKSALGPSGHNYKIIKWIAATQLD
jgi:hypothetical protein